MVGVGVGLVAQGLVPFVATFACFLARAYDQVRMAGISRSTINLCGSHAGISIGEDGPSQMALEDLASFRAIPGAAILYPADAVATERLVEAAARYNGITYMRTSRPKTPVIYANEENFPIPGLKVLRQGAQDRATVISAGVTLWEALKAADQLRAKGISVRVIDLYCLKPLDTQALAEQVRATGGRVVTVEDHYPEGGISETVLSGARGGGRASHGRAKTGGRARAAFGSRRRTAGYVWNFGAAHRRSGRAVEIGAHGGKTCIGGIASGNCRHRAERAGLLGLRRRPVED